MQTPKSSDTFVFVIENNFPDLIMEIKQCREVVSVEPFPNYSGSKRSQKHLESGYWVNTDFGLPEKAEILQIISDELDLGLIIELVTGD